MVETFIWSGPKGLTALVLSIIKILEVQRVNLSLGSNAPARDGCWPGAAEGAVSRFGCV